jgi:hypothetical protein
LSWSRLRAARSRVRPKHDAPHRGGRRYYPSPAEEASEVARPAERIGPRGPGESKPSTGPGARASGLTPPPGNPPGWPGPCTKRGVRAVEVRPSCEHAELPSCRRAGPGRWQCHAARGLTPLAGTLPSPAASESVFRYREDRCRTLQVGHWRSPRYAPWLSGGSSARFRVVSASHTMSRRKFKSHRSDLRSQPRLLEPPPSSRTSDRKEGLSAATETASDF